MSSRYSWFISISICFLLISFELRAQKSVEYNSCEEAWQDGVALFQNRNFGAARHAFSQFVKRERFSERSTRARFYIACCAIELFRPDAEQQMKAFVREHPESPFLNKAYFLLGCQQYRNKKYTAALVWFKQVETHLLSDESEVEYWFKMGYSYFKNEEYESAVTAFAEIKDIKGSYQSPANYYYAHIAYLNKKYQVALNGFEKLVEDKTFASVIPYYISQIYYLQNKYQKVLEYAPQYLEQASIEQVPVIARIIGQSYYRINQYKEAVPYLERFRDEGAGMAREDKFELGYCYYKLGEYNQSVDLLETLGGKEDALLHTASYCLADCYLKLGDKQRAKAAFATTARMDFDKDIQQDALFNFAKITYELSYSPFNETIKAFDEYLQKYPDSDRNDEAYDYLVKVYMTTRNYKDALISMDRIRRKTPAIEEAYQRVAYLRGVELFKQLKYKESIDSFEKSLAYRHYNRQVTAECLYWKAEAYYRTEQYDESGNYFQEFLDTPGASLTDNYNRAYYNRGYVCFKQGEYEEAANWFRKFENLVKQQDSELLTDARNRIGDYYFLNREYLLAAKYYDHSIKSGNWDTDYAIYQKGFALGLQGLATQKVEALQMLLDNYSQSSYVDDALYEMGNAWVMAGKEDKAMESYKELIRRFPSSNYCSRALLQLGLLNYNGGSFEDALVAYKQVVDKYPETSEYRSAIIGLKNVYVDLNRVDDYFSYISSLGEGAALNVSQMDSLKYLSAEKLYMTGKLTEASKAFDQYMSSFPNGNFLLNSNFYKAECYLQQGNIESALVGYEFVLSKAQNLFTEQALKAASELNYKKEDFARARSQYLQLEQLAEIPSNVVMARIGRMRCSYRLQMYMDCIKDCEILFITDKVGDEIVREARFNRAKSMLALKQTTLALNAFGKLARETRSKEGAEAKYRVAQLLFELNRLDEAEKEINSFIEMNSPHQYWLAESFILLSKVFLAKKDLFQARYTLESIVDNYRDGDDGIVERARLKLDSLLDVEKAEAIKLQTNEVKIPFGDGVNDKQNKLFEQDKDSRDTLGLDEAHMMLEEMLKQEKENQKKD